MEAQFVKVAEKSEIEPGKIKAVKVGDKDIPVANVGGEFYAIAGKCTHMKGDLSKGTLEGNIITCPRHHAKFDVTTGKVVSHPKMRLFHPKARNELIYQVKVDQEKIMVKL